MPPSVLIRVLMVARPPGTQHVTQQHSPSFDDTSARTKLGQHHAYIPVIIKNTTDVIHENK